MPDSNGLLTQITQRYTIPLPNSLEPDEGFVSAILRSFEENSFAAAEFDRFPIELIVDYVKRTHALYLQKTLPEIEQSILLIHDYYTPSHPLLQKLHSFFQRYYTDLSTHLEEEETKLLPYILLLVKAEKDESAIPEFLLQKGEYSIRKFVDGHHDTEDELTEMRRTISGYTPPPTNESLYRILLLQLESFEQDLRVHARMEEDVLIPKALTLETGLDRKLMRSAKWN
jgi:regulator of cell morphogenesis and NO signaling